VEGDDSETNKINKPGVLESSVVEGWQCNHCGIQSWNRNAARIQFHLGGDTSLRSIPNGFNGVEVCTKAPEAIMEAAKREMQEKSTSMDSRGKRAAEADSISTEDGQERAQSMKQSKLPGTHNKPVLNIKADNAVSDFFDATATPHAIVDSYYFRTMIDDIQAAGPGYNSFSYLICRTSVNKFSWQVYFAPSRCIGRQYFDP